MRIFAVIRFCFAVWCVSMAGTPVLAQSSVGFPGANPDDLTNKTTTENLLPVQQYAVFDLCAGLDPSPVVQSTALDDGNNAAFLYATEYNYDPAAAAKFIVQRWHNGALTKIGEFPLALRDTSTSETRGYYPIGVTASGTAYGAKYYFDGAFGHYYGFIATPSGGVSQLSETAPPLPYQAIPANMPPALGVKGFTSGPVVDATNGGNYAQQNACYTDILHGNNPPERRYGTLDYIHAASRNVFFDPSLPDGGQTPDIRRVHFGVSEINEAGCALGYGGPSRFWDGASVVELPEGTSRIYYCLTKESRALAIDWTGAAPDGALWQSAASGGDDNALAKFSDLLVGGAWEGQIKRIEPLALSNENPADQSFFVLTSVENYGRADEIVLWKSVQPPTPPGRPKPPRKWQLSAVRLPEGADIDWGSVTINYQGVINVLSNAGHSLLLVPVAYRPVQPEAGLDTDNLPHWLMVPEGGTNSVQVVSPASPSFKIGLALEPGDATWPPPFNIFFNTASITSSPQTVTMNGFARGEFVPGVQPAFPANIGTGGELKVAIKKQQTMMRVLLHCVSNSTNYGLSQNCIPQFCPSAIDLQSFLNRVYGLQANVFFTVDRKDEAVLYDIGPFQGTVGMPLSDVDIGLGKNSDEWAVVRQLRDNSYDINVFYVHDFIHFITGNVIFRLKGKVAIGWFDQQNSCCIAKDFSAPDECHVIAHEIGHFLGLSHSDDPEAMDGGINPAFLRNALPTNRLMYSTTFKSGEVGHENPHALIKQEWDEINHD